MRLIFKNTTFWKDSCNISIMKAQNYSNHRMFYPPHHFIYLPMLIILEIFGMYKIWKENELT